MILPTKHIPVKNSFLGLGGIILVHLDRSKTVTALWNEVSARPEFATFERFILTLDLLYMIGAIELKEGLLRKNSC
ncbi:ABC-three component system middle component 6 [Spirulina sp. 06S082]|uniref:ABC-three component system middle component 6 n=1 Tax=Spirulina sp. 06S082 TaxID=3110248 RepID=UPI003A4DADE9